MSVEVGPRFAWYIKVERKVTEMDGLFTSMGTPYIQVAVYTDADVQVRHNRDDWYVAQCPTKWRLNRVIRKLRKRYPQVVVIYDEAGALV